MFIGKESEQIEFKKSTSEAKEAIISISSILNKHGSGTVFFGVKDNGEVVGQDIGKDTLRYLSRDIANGINPSFLYSVEERSTIDGKKFIEVQFSGSAAPYSAYGKYYERFADEDKAISDAELERLFAARRKDYSEWENKESDAETTEVDGELFKEMMARGKDVSRLNYKSFNQNTLLSKLGLVAKDGKHLNNAGRVLFSSNKPIILKLATFASNNKDTFIRLNHFEGNIYECIDEGIRYISESINWNVKIDGSAKRDENPEIPLVAIREIVINAFAHGEYGANTTFEINVFKNRVVVYSPGLFPIGYRPEDFADNHEEPIMLNPKIVNVLFKTGEIESFGSGFGRVFTSCRKAGVDYTYENTKSGFRFIFYRPLGHDNVQEMSETEKNVLDEIRNNSMATAKTIAEKINKSEKTVYRAISKLKDRDIVVREGGDYNGKWIIK